MIPIRYCTIKDGIILFLILTIMYLCFSSYEVKAYNLIPTRASYYNGSTNVPLNLTGQTIQGTEYYAADFTDVNFQQINVQFNINLSGNLDVNFQLYSAMRTTPIITFNDVACFVQTGQLTTSDNTVVPNALMNVKCESVPISAGYIEARFLYTSQYGQNNGKWGVSKNFKFVDPNTGSESIVDSIKDQTDQQHKDSQATQENIQEATDTIKDDNTEGASSSATGFFNDFEDNDYGFSDIIKMPLSYIKNITSTTCSAVSVPLPFVDQNATLPCMDTIYLTYFGSFLNIYQTITFGIIAYWVCMNLFSMVKNFKDPQTDRIEVFDL